MKIPPIIIPTNSNVEYCSSTDAENYDYLIKIQLMGDQGVGKSSLMRRLSDDNFYDDSISTSHDDFKMHNVRVDEKVIKAQICDTANKARFGTITSGYDRGYSAVLLAFDTTDQVSFNNITQYLKEIDRYLGSPSIILIGTKADLTDRRVVDVEVASEFAEAHGLLYVETSAKTGDNVHVAVDEAICMEVAKRNRQEYRPIQVREEQNTLQTQTIKGIINKHLTIYQKRGNRFFLFSKNPQRDAVLTNLIANLTPLFEKKICSDDDKVQIVKAIIVARNTIETSHKNGSIPGKLKLTKSRLVKELNNCLNDLVKDGLIDKELISNQEIVEASTPSGIKLVG